MLLGQFLILTLLSPASFGILVGPLLVGFTYSCLRKVDGHTVEFGDLFKGFDNFGHALLASVLVSLAVSAGFTCCIVPGIFLLVKWYFWQHAMADRPGRSALEALTDAWTVSEGRFLDLLALGIVGVAVSFAGFCLCIVGFWPATVVVTLAGVVAFRQLVPKAA